MPSADNVKAEPQDKPSSKFPKPSWKLIFLAASTLASPYLVDAYIEGPTWSQIAHNDIHDKESEILTFQFWSKGSVFAAFALYTTLAITFIDWVCVSKNGDKAIRALIASLCCGALFFSLRAQLREQAEAYVRTHIGETHRVQCRYNVEVNAGKFARDHVVRIQLPDGEIISVVEKAHKMSAKLKNPDEGRLYAIFYGANELLLGFVLE